MALQTNANLSQRCNGKASKLHSTHLHPKIHKLQQPVATTSASTKIICKKTQAKQWDRQGKDSEGVWIKSWYVGKGVKGYMGSSKYKAPECCG